MGQFPNQGMADSEHDDGNYRPHDGVQRTLSCACHDGMWSSGRLQDDRRSEEQDEHPVGLFEVCPRGRDSVKSKATIVMTKG